MGRNAQVWTHDFELLLDGPHAGREELLHAAAQLAAGGAFGYRFVYPAMRVEQHEVYWQRPLVGYMAANGEPQFLSDAPLGYMTAYKFDKPNLAKPIELWPRLLSREPHVKAVSLFHVEHDTHCHRTTVNVHAIAGYLAVVRQAAAPAAPLLVRC